MLAGGLHIRDSAAESLFIFVHWCVHSSGSGALSKLSAHTVSRVLGGLLRRLTVLYSVGYVSATRIGLTMDNIASKLSSADRDSL